MIHLGFWNNKKVLITGGAGFIGSHLADLLVSQGAEVSVTTLRKNDSKVKKNLADSAGKIDVVEADLREKKSAEKAVDGAQVVFHLAAIVGGVKFNLEHPAAMLRDNSAITSNVLEACRARGVERSVIVSSATVYPDSAQGALKEELGFVGEPDSTKFGYAWSKRFDELLAKAYATEFGMKIGIARPFNVYGPRDVFDPVKSHVIPSIIHQIREKGSVKVFGDGRQERSFIFVKDLAEGLALLCEKHPSADAINLGTREGVKIIDLAQKIAKIMGKNPKIETDQSSNAGSRKRVCDTAKAEKLLGFKAKTSLDEGLKQTIEWLEKNGKSG